MSRLRLLALILALVLMLALPGPATTAQGVVYDHFLYLPTLVRLRPGAPGAPTLSASAPSQGRVTLSWTAPSGVVEAYSLWRGAASHVSGATLVYSGDARQHTITLPPGTHYFRVQAGNLSGATASNVVSVFVPTPPTPTPTPTPTPPPVNVCAEIPGAGYGTLSVNGPATDRPAENHADLNLALRGYEPTAADPWLVEYSGGTDSRAPQLRWLFTDNRPANIRATYRVFNWDWSSNRRAGPITDWPTTLIGLAAAPGEILRLPDSGYDIGQGYEALVLYASETRITLKYTREDNVVYGYTVHLENICVEPRLLALYRQQNTSGRDDLPALHGGQPLGRARSEVGVAMRDTGRFMDPRSRKDWWARTP